MDRPPPDPASSASAGARRVYSGFVDYFSEFVGLSRRACGRFERRDWVAHQLDSRARLDLYGHGARAVLERLRDLLGDRFDDRKLWTSVKAAYGELLTTERNPELARTFFNSVTRRVFGTVGVDPDIEFAAIELCEPACSVSEEIFARYEPRGDTADVILRILEDQRLRVPYRSAKTDAALVAQRIDDVLDRAPGSPILESFEVLRPKFFRNKAAYIIGRIHTGAAPIPLVLPLLNTDRGVVVDAVLTGRSDVSILFSFTRSYFHVEADCPRELIAFLNSIIPEKPLAELYTSLGLYKHGKTELYRSLRRHLDRSSDRFEIATGDVGMVMLVFTLPSYDRVFKLIRDEFAFPKNTTAREVRKRYRLVFERDRVGRLVEAQQFAHLRFRRDRFAPDLLRELLEDASRIVQEDGDWITIEHLYTERRVRPLNLYLREATASDARLAILDYGRAIKELAAADIFPGDFLLKNFGVTRHGRVVFYDYDELCLLTDCRFREFPTPRTPEDEMAAEPWFTVAEGDIFPEEFRRFLGLQDDLMAVFERHHGDLFGVAFWRGMQERQTAGEVLDFFPYLQSLRLHR